MGYGKKGALSGAASGAAMGTAVMPGIGTGVGALLGGLSGFLTGRGKDKASKQAFEADKAAEGGARTNAFTKFLNQQRGVPNQQSKLGDMVEMGRFLGAFGGREKAPPSLLKFFENIRTNRPDFVYEGPTAQAPIEEPMDYTGLLKDIGTAYLGTRVGGSSPSRGGISGGATSPAQTSSFTPMPLDLGLFDPNRKRGFLG